MGSRQQEQDEWGNRERKHMASRIVEGTARVPTKVDIHNQECYAEPHAVGGRDSRDP